MKGEFENVATLVILLLGSSFSVVECIGENQNLINFLMVEFRNYTNWLHENNLEPSPLIPTVVDMSDTIPNIYNLTGNIRNQHIFGHSNIHAWNIDSKLEYTYLSVKLDFHTDVYSTTGEYEVDGHFFKENSTFTGKGKSNFTAKSLVVEFENYEITPEGFIDLSGASVKQEFVGGVPQVIAELEGLKGDNSDIEEHARIWMALIYNRKLSSWHPVGDYLKTFMQESFDKTTLADIIGIP